MTRKQKALIQRSWAALGDQADVTMDLFYQRLFEVSPNARELFRDKDMRLQATAFTQMLAMFIRSVADEEPGLAEAIQASGRRHVGYGVMHSDYAGAGDALLWALAQALGERFTPEVREAWADAYRTLSTTMRQASSNVL